MQINVTFAAALQGQVLKCPVSPGKCQSHIFAIISILFLNFYTCHPRKGLLPKIHWYKRCEKIKRSLSEIMPSYDLVRPKRWEHWCSEDCSWTWLCWSTMIFVEVFLTGTRWFFRFVTDIFCFSIKCEWFPHSCWLTL